MMLTFMSTSSIRARYVAGLGMCVGGGLMLTFLLTSSIRARYVPELGMEDRASWAALLFFIALEPYIDINVNITICVYVYIFCIHI